MFGYVIPLKPELKIKDFEVFRGMYCGLCHTLRKRYGFGTENILSYDMCFLALLVSQADRCEIERCEKRCVSSPFRKKNCVVENRALQYAADAAVILGYYKIVDGINDESFFKACCFRTASLFMKSKYKKAVKSLPEFDSIVKDRLKDLSDLEASQCDSIDRTADTFAQILRSLSDEIYDDKLRRVTGEILYHVGRWIYILDAWDDLDEDVHKGKYNPVYRRFFPCSDKERIKEEVKNTLYRSMETAANCAQLLPEGRFMPIINNILYQGLPNVSEQVLDGKFKTKKFLKGRIENGSL